MPVFFDISRHLTNKYFDKVWGYDFAVNHPNELPKANFLNGFSWGASFLKSVNICVGHSKRLLLSKLSSSFLKFLILNQMAILTT